ncbi:MAG TPA: hypothetical protein VGJ86_08475 [Acidimicrobiales bacterium]
MFSVHCPRHGHDVLLGHRQIRGIEGSGSDLTLRWVCWCGQRGDYRPHRSPARL